MRRVGMIATLVAAAIGVASGALAQGSPPGAPPPAKAGRATLNLASRAAAADPALSRCASRW